MILFNNLLLCYVEIEIETKKIQVGSIVRTYSGWVEKAVLSASDCERIPDELIQAVGPEQQLAALGMVGRTAFFGIDAGKKKKIRKKN